MDSQQIVGKMCDFALYSNNYVNMSYGSHFKIKILACLLLGDFEIFLLPPRNPRISNMFNFTIDMYAFYRSKECSSEVTKEMARWIYSRRVIQNRIR